jgi:hypothetical protein
VRTRGETIRVFCINWGVGMGLETHSAHVHDIKIREKSIMYKGDRREQYNIDKFDI